MKKNSRVSEAYGEIVRLGRGPMDASALARLSKAIDGRTSLLVSAAADVAAEHGLRGLVPQMIEAFPRFIEDGAEVDKGCRAKTSIVKALNAFEYLGDEVFLTGAYHVQMEPAFGLPEDTAVDLRALSAFALARIVHPQAHPVLADLLMDSEMGVRAAAARALAYLGTPEAEMMLRVKVLCAHPREEEVLAECFVALMTMAPQRSLDFVARFLAHRSEQTMESAAIALGGSHLPEALALLKRLWDDAPFPSVHRMLLLPIALNRSDDAFAHLLMGIRESDRVIAGHAISAARLYTGETYVSAVQEAVENRHDPALTAKYHEEFG